MPPWLICCNSAGLYPTLINGMVAADSTGLGCYVQAMWGSGRPIIKPPFTPAFAANSHHQHCLLPQPDAAHHITAISWIAGILGASLSSVSAVSAYAQPAVPLHGNHRGPTSLPAWVMSQCYAKAGGRVSCSLTITAASAVTTLPGVHVGTGVMTKVVAARPGQLQSRCS